MFQLKQSQLTVDTNVSLRLTNKYVKHVADARFGVVLTKICRQSRVEIYTSSRDTYSNRV